MTLRTIPVSICPESNGNSDGVEPRFLDALKVRQSDPGVPMVC